MDFNEHDYFLYMTTVQSGAIRTLVEVLKEVLNDVNIVFDETGARITAMDASHVALIHMKLLILSSHVKPKVALSYSFASTPIYWPKSKDVRLSICMWFRHGVILHRKSFALLITAPIIEV